MTMSKPILLISIGFLICLVRAWGQKGPLAPAGRILKKRQTNENQEFLNAHNERRRNVNPSASNMKEMIWSDELYTIARNYAQQCSFSHNSQRSSQSQTFSYVGENIYMGTFGTATDAVRSWDEEKSYYDLSSNTCTRTCGHYTQVVWTDSEYLGCARQQCGNSYLIVCNYGPG
ncbi:GLIPR1-like protein 1 [Saccostrea cucullata]|uniref:GLIPR1-like protein 1 n=1 Tax=Saccostrea cuccullata TaxID=36930 RepID=UPI002ED645CF